MGLVRFLLDDAQWSWPYLVRLLFAAVCGAAIGFERTRKRKSAGTRTHIMVAVGAALIIVVSKYGFFDVVVHESVSVDASRVAAQVVSGVGFLGAGIIFFKNDAVRGLTTAAGVWATAGVGLAAGAGMYTVCLAATVMIIAIHIVIGQPNVPEGVESDMLEVTVYNEPGALECLTEELQKMNLQIRHCHISRRKNNTVCVRFRLGRPADLEWIKVLELVQRNEYVKSIGI